MFSKEMSVIKQSKIIDSVKVLLDQMPNDWLRLTTHRLDIYVEKLAKKAFLEQLESLVDANNITSASLSTLPTAFDYIRLGHPLSCLLEWSLAKINHLSADKMISFSSKTAPILAVLRKNLFENKKTLICYKGQLPEAFIADNIKAIYGYQFELLEVEDINAIPSFEGSIIYVNETNSICEFELNSNIDFAVQVHPILGSVIAINGEQNAHYKEEIQHVKKYHKISDFSLTNQNGKQITQGYYENQIYIADFFFTTCPSICPIMTKNMYQIQQKTMDKNVLLVSYSVTPEIDNVDQLKKYALENKVNDNKWNLLTGDKKQIYELARKSYLVAKNDGDGGKYDMIHTENFVLIDREKRIRGYYDGTNKEEVDKLLSDVKILENSYKNSKNEKNNI